jgi:hypothetical protein
MIEIDRLTEGAYIYLNQGTPYAEENFSLDYIQKSKSYLYSVELLSRTDSGEFLKLKIRYELNNFYYPLTLNLERTLGDKKAYEFWQLDHTKLVLQYVYRNKEGSKNHERPWAPKHFLTAPCFTTSCLFTHTKKFEPTGRTPVIYVGTENVWEFEHFPQEKMLYFEHHLKPESEFKLNQKKCDSTQLSIFTDDGLQNVGSPQTKIWLSDLYALPYKLVDHTGIEICMKRLKRKKQEEIELLGD